MRTYPNTQHLSTPSTTSTVFSNPEIHRISVVQTPRQNAKEQNSATPRLIQWLSS